MDDSATDLGGAGFGLMYYGARFYDPVLGRFSSPDTIIPEQTQGTQAWDRFSYTNNNPMRYTDPSGHCISDPLSAMICATIIGGVVSGVFNYASQVRGNLQSGDDWQTALTSVDPKEIAVAAAGGAVAGATMIVAGAIVVPYVGATAGAFIAGGVANLVAGQYEAVLSSGIDQAQDIASGQSFDKDEFSQTAEANGYGQWDVMTADAATGAVVGGLTRIGLNQVTGPALHPNINMSPSRIALLESKGYITGFSASAARGFSNMADETILRGLRQLQNPYILDQEE